MQKNWHNVLLIDDDIVFAGLIRSLLSTPVPGSLVPREFNLFHADYLQGGLDRLSEGGIDVVLLDLSLPDSDGIDTFTMVYARFPRVPIIVLTGFDDEDLATETVRKGAQDYVIKGNTNRLSLARSIRYAIAREETYKQGQALAAFEERQRLARDLHDSVSQTLFSVGVITETLLYQFGDTNEALRQGLNNLHRLTKGARAEMRILLAELRPTALTDIPLPELLRQLTEAVASRTLIPITLTLNIPEEDNLQRVLPPDVQVSFFRIAQEGLNNAIKHALAQQVSVTLIHEQHTFILQITDNGRGFDPLRISQSGHGLKIMRERAIACGADLTLESQPGAGCKLSVYWRFP